MSPRTLTSLACLLAGRATLASRPAPASAQNKPRARDLGIPFDGTPGPLNRITDVPGVTVGYQLDPLFLATVRGVEESIINALVAAESMTGVNGNTIPAIDPRELQAI